LDYSLTILQWIVLLFGLNLLGLGLLRGWRAYDKRRRRNLVLGRLESSGLARRTLDRSAW